MTAVVREAADQIRELLSRVPESARTASLGRRLDGYLQIASTWPAEPPTRLQRVALLECLVTLRDEAATLAADAAQ